jgi:hypothetical protein
MNTKEHYIEFFRQHGFNCFPIPQYPESEPEQKKADGRYNSSRTSPNQPVKDNENYGVIALKDAGTIFLDLDHKELYRKFAEENITNGYMVIETPNGWHIPVVGLSGTIKKMMFYDLDIEPEKQIVEIQGFDHYVVGCGCSIWNKKTGRRGYYENKGTDVIWNAKGMNFNDFCDILCKKLGVKPKDSGKSANYNMRQRFLQGKPPTKGTSNNYFYNAAIQCLSDGLTQNEAELKIQKVYDKWVASDTYSGRTWDNVLAKIKDAYENGEPLKEGRPTKNEKNNLVILCQKMIADRKIYSDQETKELWENVDGYLENITNKMHKPLQQTYPEITKDVRNEIIDRLIGLAPDLPETNKSLKVFDNGVYDERVKQIINTEEIAAMGFKGYQYLEALPENIPTKFIDIVFKNVPEHEHKRIKAGLKAAITPKLDPRISVIHGKAGTGKSLGMEILFKVMNRYEQYALTLELDQLLNDSFIKAKINGKTLLVLTDLPEQYKDFSKLKAITGEGVKTERAFYADATTFDNKLKIFATTNYLAKIPTKEKNAMYRRLSLIHNTREIAYEVNPDLADEVVKEEGEKIISWILNIPDTECDYEISKTLKEEWEGLASPEIEYMEKYWQFGETMNEVSVMKLRKDFEEKYQTSMTHTQFTDSLKDQGYYIQKNMVANIIPVIQKEKVEQGKL